MRRTSSRRSPGGMSSDSPFLDAAASIGHRISADAVWHEGRCSPVDELHLDNSFDDTGLGGRALCLELKAGSERFLITGEAFFSVPLPIDGPGFSTMYTISRTRYQFRDRTGYGVAEFLERLRP